MAAAKIFVPSALDNVIWKESVR